MSLGTLSFEIDADASGFDEGTSEVEERLQAIEEQLGATTEAAEEASEKLSSIGQKMNLGMAVKAAKMAAHAMKELGAFILDSAKAAADSGSGPMKKFVENVDALHRAFQKVGAQAASQLAPVLQQITDTFLNSTEAAKGLKEAGNFIANVFRVVATVGVAVVSVFDAVGTAIAGVASMIVDVLSGNMSGAAEAWKMLGEEIDKTMTKAGERVEVIWQKGQDFTGTISGVAKKAPTGMTGEEKAEVAAINRRNEIQSIEEAADARRAEIDAIGDTEKQFEIATKGFKDVNEAIENYEAVAKSAADERQAAVDAEIAGRFFEAERHKIAAQTFDESAQKAAGAIDAFAEQLKNDVNTVGGAMAALGGAILQAVPRLNDLVSAAMQGAQAGGIWGALIAVIVQLLSQTEAFEKILDIVNRDLDQLVGAVEPLAEGILSLMDALDPITNVITDLVGGALRPIGAILKIISPLLGLLMAPLTAMFDIIGKGLGVLGDFFEGIENFFKGKGFRSNKQVTAAAAAAAAAGPSANQQFENSAEGQSVLAQIDAAEKALAAAEAATLYALKTRNLADEERAALFKEEEDARAALHRLQEDATRAEAKFISTLEMIDSVNRSGVLRLEQMTKAQFLGASALDDFTKTTIEATEALSNIPAGYKIAQTRFASMAGETVPQMAGGGLVTKPLLAMIGEAGPEAVIPLDMLGGMIGGGGGGGTSINIESITIVASDPASFWKELRRTIQRESFIRTGASVASAPQWVGG